MSAKRPRPIAGHDWITPKEALAIVSEAIGDSAQSIIMERLSGNLLQAVAGRVSLVDDDGEPDISEDCPIDAGLWQHLQQPMHLWAAAQARFYLRDPIYGARTFTCTDIRFLKEHVLRMFPNRPTPASERSEMGNAIEPISKGRPVSDADLKRWAELYVAVYPENEDTGDKAWESAKGMFQGKSVSRKAARDAIAALRPRKRGRKAAGE